MFPVLYDLREKLKEHASTVQPQLFQLMSDLLKKTDNLLESDRKYADLPDDLAMDLAAWEETEPQPQPATTPSGPKTPTQPSTTGPLHSLMELNKSLQTPKSRRRTFGGRAINNSMNMSLSSRRQSFDGKARAVSTPFHDKNARMSLGSAISNIRTQGDTSQGAHFNVTTATDQTSTATGDDEDSFVIN